MDQQTSRKQICRNKTANVYTEWLPLIEGLSNEEAGKIFKGILKYQNGEDIKIENPIWNFIEQKLNQYNEDYRNTSSARSEAGRLGGLAKASNAKQKVAKLSKSGIKENKIKENKILSEYPTLEEVTKYATSRGREDLAKDFFDYFKISNWIDSKGNKVKNWKQKFLTWEKHSEKPQGKNYSERGFS
jgi:hypothetical protein